MIKVIECPRDAMQGMPEFIPTEDKAHYLNLLLKVGFDTIDFGSFVSPKAIPQLRDTAEVLEKINMQGSISKLLAIVANTRGAQEAAQFEEIYYLGFPLSISETFQKRNTNKTIEEALAELCDIQEVCKKTNKELVIYLSMGFGNPYGDPYHPEAVLEFVQKVRNSEVRIISLADTVGTAETETITYLFRSCSSEFADVEFGAHFHSNPTEAQNKISAAYSSGCRRFDTALKGYGGCPMAKDDLVGNIATESLISFFQKKEKLNFNLEYLNEAQLYAINIFEEIQ